MVGSPGAQEPRDVELTTDAVPKAEAVAEAVAEAEPKADSTTPLQPTSLTPTSRPRNKLQATEQDASTARDRSRSDHDPDHDPDQDQYQYQDTDTEPKGATTNPASPQNPTPHTHPFNPAPTSKEAPISAQAAAAQHQVQQVQPAQTAQPVAPVPPGPRAARMQQLYAQSLRRALSKLGWENFAACYPTIAGRAEPILRQVQAQMVEKLGEKCEKEFEHIMATRQVVPKLNELEALIADASRRRASSASAPPIPPHKLPPTAILAAHLLPSLASHQSHLNARLQTTQSRNAMLFEAVRSQREQVHALLADLEHVVGDVRAANAVLGGVVEDIAREAREADVEV